MQYYMLKEVCEINPSKQIDLSLDDRISFVPMDSVSVRGDIDTSKSISISSIKSYSIFREGDVLFAKITPCMENGKGCIAHGLLNGYGAGSTEFIVLRPNSRLLTNKWLYYFLSQQNFRQECKQHMTGSAGQKRVPPKYLGSCIIPVPSISEQQRIVARIEEFFSQLDDAEATLQKTKAHLALYRQAVLKEAFQGKEQWDKYTFNDLLAGMRNGYGEKPTDSGDHKILRISAVRPLVLNLSDYRMNQDAFTEENLIQENDLLFTRYNGSQEYVGVCARVPSLDDDYAYPDKIIRCRLKHPESILAKYLMYYLNSGDARKYIRSKIKTTSGQKGIAGGDIKKTVVYIPDQEKQTAVIDYIESRGSLCDCIEQYVDLSLKELAALRQSILKRVYNQEDN